MTVLPVVTVKGVDIQKSKGEGTPVTPGPFHLHLKGNLEKPMVEEPRQAVFERRIGHIPVFSLQLSIPCFCLCGIHRTKGGYETPSRAQGT